MDTDSDLPTAGDQYPRRLMISKMVLENFKSYAGEQHVGPFHKSFSSVVGPNGSGKSNVIDAMLFVFGRRANQMRFKKVSELIHKSSNHTNLQYAKVSVHFQEIIDKEGEDFEVVAGSELVVARVATQSNESHYTVNGRKVTAKEVTELLKGKGIDLDNNRFLILQGEVESISMMKPKAEDGGSQGLLEYLEDIIGTDKFVAPIQEEAKKLEEVSERRVGLVQRLKAAEKEVDSLRGKRDEAADYLERQGRMLRLKLVEPTCYVEQTQASLATLDTKVAELSAKHAHEQGKLGTYDRDTRAAEAKLAAACKGLDAANKALDAASEAFKALERRDAQCSEDAKQLQAKVKKAAGKRATDAKALERLEAELAALAAELPALQRAVEGTTAELAAAEARAEALVEGVKGEVEGYHQQLSQVRSRLAPWEQQMSVVASRASMAAAERDLLAKQGKDAHKRLDDAIAALACARTNANAKGSAIKTVEAALAECRKQQQLHQETVERARLEEDSLTAQISELRSQAMGLRSELGSLQSNSVVVRELAAAKAAGEVSGVYGRLGDLGAIDAKYDVAVSTATGGLDYVVVETASDAQVCVEFLRRRKLGVAPPSSSWRSSATWRALPQ
ncbi:MAG: hypothetical protein WDW36_009641 [Sanguina aurantia]